MTAREGMFESDTLGDDMDKLQPIITKGVQSDTASFDNALELLSRHRALAAARLDDDDTGGVGRPSADGPG